MYAQSRRRVTGKKTNFSRDAQPYIFSNLKLESFELGKVPKTCIRGAGRFFTYTPPPQKKNKKQFINKNNFHCQQSPTQIKL